MTEELGEVQDVLAAYSANPEGFFDSPEGDASTAGDAGSAVPPTPTPPPSRRTAWSPTELAHPRHLIEIHDALRAELQQVRDVVAEACGRVPVLSTSGGTSDARYVKNHCPVLEFGLVGAFMHQVDERVPQAQVRQLKDIYQTILQRYFG